VRIVLSRKGFDSSAGGGPSPLLPDGRLVSLPIPERRPTPHSPLYEELGFASMLRALGYPAAGPAHLDPDLVAGLRRRQAGWRGAFGQVGAAASHLLGRNVGVGDLFLFFGLFRRVELGANGYRFMRSDPPFHAIWGYLEIERRVQATDSPPDWARDHPHFADPGRGRPNLVFLSRTDGFGVFRYSDGLRLTRPGAKLVTDWLLPPCFEGVDLTYHARSPRNRRLRAASRGQEFVCDATSEVELWADALISESERWGA
jgi:hypothetical protein